jgi:hypothetical protein
MKNITMTILVSILGFSQICFAQVKAKLTFINYITSDMSVFVESYDKNGKLKANESFVVAKSTILDKSTTPTTHLFESIAFKGGKITIKWNPILSNTKFTENPIQIPNSNLDVNRSIPLTGLILYDVNDNKQRLIAVGTNLKFDSATTFTRLIDVKQQLGSLIIGKIENNVLKIIENIPLKEVNILYDTPSVLKESTVTDKSVLSQLKTSVPIYGSLESLMSTSDLYQVMWDISYYPFQSNVGFSSLIMDLDASSKQVLLNKLRLNLGYDIFLLRNFDIIESGIFSVTTGTKINTEANAAIASVFTASAAYAFKSEDSKFISIPNKVYNMKYEKWQSVSDLISKLELHYPLKKDGTVAPNQISSMLLGF